MHLFLLALAICTFRVCAAKDETANDPYFKKKVSETHFGKVGDFKQLNLPQESENGFDFTNDGSGNYNFQFSTNELQRYEVGELKNAGTVNEIQVVRGQYIDTEIYPSGEKIVRTIGYTADENGYQPYLIDVAVLPAQAAEVAYTPRPPPIPEYTTPRYTPPIPYTRPPPPPPPAYAPSHAPPPPPQPGAPKGKTEISAATLGSLIGGNG